MPKAGESARRAKATQTEQITRPNGGDFGFGWNVNRDPQERLRLTHSGAFELGAATHVHIAPAEELGIIILTNAAPVGLPEGLVSTFIDTVLYEEPTRDWIKIYREGFAKLKEDDFADSRAYEVPPVAPAPPAANTVYLGRFTNDFYGEISVVEHNGGLVLRLGPEQKAYPMTPWDGDTFTDLTDGESGTGTSGLLFTVNEGAAATLAIQNLNKFDTGTFTRVTEGP